MSASTASLAVVTFGKTEALLREWAAIANERRVEKDWQGASEAIAVCDRLLDLRSVLTERWDVHGVAAA